MDTESGSVADQPPLTSRTSTFLKMTSRGTVAIPPDIRRRHRLDEPGAQVAVIEREDGVIELHPHVPRPADQAWFWTDQWQHGEREVDAHVAAGEITTHESGEAFLAHLADLRSGS